MNLRQTSQFPRTTHAEARALTASYQMIGCGRLPWGRRRKFEFPLNGLTAGFSGCFLAAISIWPSSSTLALRWLYPQETLCGSSRHFLCLSKCRVNRSRGETKQSGRRDSNAGIHLGNMALENLDDLFLGHGTDKLIGDLSTLEH